MTNPIGLRYVNNTIELLQCCSALSVLYSAAHAWSKIYPCKHFETTVPPPLSPTASRYALNYSCGRASYLVVPGIVEGVLLETSRAFPINRFLHIYQKCFPFHFHVGTLRRESVHDPIVRSCHVEAGATAYFDLGPIVVRQFVPALFWGIGMGLFSRLQPNPRLRVL